MAIKLFNDNFQNYKSYGIPKAQLLIADIPYNLAENAYASNPMWYVDGDLNKGTSNCANKNFFNTDGNFNIAEFFHFASKLLKKEPKERNKAPAMIVLMILNWFKWYRDPPNVPRIHSTQKPINLLSRLIEIFTDIGDVVIDPCAGSGNTFRACAEINRNCYGFEIDKTFYKAALSKMLNNININLFANAEQPHHTDRRFIF